MINRNIYIGVILFFLLAVSLEIAYATKGGGDGPKGYEKSFHSAAEKAKQAAKQAAKGLAYSPSDPKSVIGSGIKTAKAVNKLGDAFKEAQQALEKVVDKPSQDKPSNDNDSGIEKCGKETGKNQGSKDHGKPSGNNNGKTSSKDYGKSGEKNNAKSGKNF
jgi:hypothetical protein